MIFTIHGLVGLNGDELPKFRNFFLYKCKERPDKKTIKVFDDHSFEDYLVSVAEPSVLYDVVVPSNDRMQATYHVRREADNAGGSPQVDYFVLTFSSTGHLSFASTSKNSLVEFLTNEVGLTVDINN